MSPETLSVVGIVMSSVVALLGAYFVYKIQRGRLGSQNRKDDMDAASAALEIARRAAATNLALETEVRELKRVLNAQNYRVTVVFRLGEKPSIEKATIETVSA
jgi:hypothetical protein